MLTDMQLRALKPAKKIYKVADRQGLYAAVTPSGAVSFRYDYRVNGRRETLVIGRYDPSLSARKSRKPDELGFGMAISSRKPGFYGTRPTEQSNAERALHGRRSRDGSRRPRR
jgi:Arm DNA-binding domain